MKKNSLKMRYGFTLAEVMIITAIIGILLAIAIPSFIHARDRMKSQEMPVGFNVRMTKDMVLTNVIKVFMTDSGGINKPERYVVLLRYPPAKLKRYDPIEEGIATPTGSYHKVSSVSLYMDAEVNPYISFQLNEGRRDVGAVIHIRSPQEIDGSGWIERVDDMNVERHTRSVQ
ncbi:MAG: prepilin-type N-terminal cleavage/methylation domain-containing protein [Candidatus Paceibacterota bacterium]